MSVLPQASTLLCLLLWLTLQNTGVVQGGRKWRIGVQGAPLRHGQPKMGVEKGPGTIRSSGIFQLLQREGHEVVDIGDLPFNFDTSQGERHYNSSGRIEIKNMNEVSSANYLIYSSTLALFNTGLIPVTLGGDHSIAIGTINAVTERFNGNVGILWVDSHGDINTPMTTESGYLHGMPLSFHVKELQVGTQILPQFAWVTPRVDAKNLAYIGLVDVDRPETQIMKRLGVTTFGMREIDRLGIREVVRRALDQIAPNHTRPIHVSFDIDALDDLETGGSTGTPVPGGMTLREGMTLLWEVSNLATIYSLDLVEINVDRGDGPRAKKRVAKIGGNLIGCAFGYCNGGAPGD